MSLPSRTEVSQPFRWFGARWSGFFFAGTSAAELGFHRMLFFGLVFVGSFHFQSNAALWPSVSRVFWAPTTFFDLFRIPVFSEGTIVALLWTWRVALALAAVGLFTRVACVAALVLGFYLIGLPQNFAKVHHSDTLAVIGMLVFAFSRCGAGWSVDGLIRAARSARPGLRDVANQVRSAEYSWPLALFRVMIVLVLFSAAVSKLAHVGLVGWVSSDTLYYTIIRHQYTHAPPTDIGLAFAQAPWVYRVVAFGALALEFVAPLLLFLPPRRRVLFLLPLLAMMVGFGLTLGVLFLQYIILLVMFFLPWNEMGRWLAVRLPVTGIAVLYDGSCGICQKTMAVLREVDVLGRVRIHDARNEWDDARAPFRGLSQVECLELMHAVRDDGRVSTGFYAYRELAKVVPLGWLVLPFLYVPGVPFVGQRVYASVADHRHLEGCPLPTAQDPTTRSGG